MKHLVYSVSPKQKVFYCIINGKKTGFYLSNRLAKIFFMHINKNTLVDFVVYEKRKKIDNEYVYQIAYFNSIVLLNPKRVLYDLKSLRKEMQNFLLKDRYYLFIDFEMTMPSYRNIPFILEIIQVGYVLAKINSRVVKSNSYYVYPEFTKRLTKRTRRFLNIEEETFFKEAIPYGQFYDDLKNIIKEYKPKIVTWGKNDLQALNESYRLHKRKPITKDNDFIDLLKLHKDYFNLKDDLGLLKAYKAYYEDDLIQEHNAFHDALLTKLIFEGFIREMNSLDE